MDHQQDQRDRVNPLESQLDSGINETASSNALSMPPPPFNLDASTVQAKMAEGASGEAETGSVAIAPAQMQSHDTGCGCSTCQMKAAQFKKDPTAQMKGGTGPVVQAYQEENDQSVFQGEASFSGGPVSLPDQMRIFVMSTESISLDITNEEGEAQTIRFTREWAQSPAGTAILRGRIRHEMMWLINRGESGLEYVNRLILGLNGDAARIEELQQFVAVAEARAPEEASTGARDENDPNISSPYLVEEANNSGQNWMGRGYRADGTIGTSEAVDNEADAHGALNRRISGNVRGRSDGRAQRARRERELAPEVNRIRDRAERQRRVEQLISSGQINPGPRPGWRLRSHYSRLHAAWDIGGPANTGVYSPISGVVHEIIENSGTYGNYVRILHAGVTLDENVERNRGQVEAGNAQDYITNYCHLNQVLVEPGQQVFAGQAIGLMGNTGFQGMSSHLHFSVTVRNRQGLSSGNEVRHGVRAREWFAAVTGSDTPYRQGPGTGAGSPQAAEGGDSEVPVQQKSASKSTNAPVQRKVVQMQEGPGAEDAATETASPETASPETAEEVVTAATVLTPEQVTTATTNNNNREFRLDWVRNLQLALLGSRISTDGNFDERTIRAVGMFQHAHQDACGSPDGIIGENTRRTLEQEIPSLLTTILGDHLEPRELVPAGASDEEKYQYYRSIIEIAGGVFLSTPGEINLLGIRGLEFREDGSIWQSASAQDFANARAAGTTDDHMRANGHDDMIVSLWIEVGEDGAAGAIQVRERRGSVDPSSTYNDADRPGTAHLRDGQYAFQTGTHTTSSPSHVGAVDEIEDPDNVMNRSSGTNGDGNATRTYNALRPARNQEVWRESENNNLYVDPEEEATSNTEIYQSDRDYISDGFAINIHTSRQDQGNSVACQNVPRDEYVDFISEVRESENTDNVLYTLIDASKVDLDLVTHRAINDFFESMRSLPFVGGLFGG